MSATDCSLPFSLHYLSLNPGVVLPIHATRNHRPGSRCSSSQNLSITAELFEKQNGKPKYGGDLDVIVHGRDYGNGKQVGPYVKLLTFDPLEEIMRQGEWGGNRFYISVDGRLDVFVNNGDGGTKKDKSTGARHLPGEIVLGTASSANDLLSRFRGDQVLRLVPRE